jgi:predicted RNA-binding Zn-ribbon protein involved in translation (DUF1610 family)
MKCVVCGRSLPSVNEDGICPWCGENTKIADRVDRKSRKRFLTPSEFEALLFELDKLANERRRIELPGSHSHVPGQALHPFGEA